MKKLLTTIAVLGAITTGAMASNPLIELAKMDGSAKSFRIECAMDSWQGSDGKITSIPETVKMFKGGAFPMQFKKLGLDPRDTRFNLRKIIERANGYDSVNGMMRDSKYTWLSVGDNLVTGKEIFVMTMLNEMINKEKMEFIGITTHINEDGTGETRYGWNSRTGKYRWKETMYGCRRYR
jgi:hypothetical protein